MTTLVVHVSHARLTDQQVIGRAAAMVTWLAIYADQVNETFRGSVVFDWEGPSMRPQLVSRHERINTDSLLPSSDQSST